MNQEREPAIGHEAIDARWYPGRTVWITETGEPVIVHGNKVYASDAGARVQRANGESDLIHWSKLSLDNPNG